MKSRRTIIGGLLVAALCAPILAGQQARAAELPGQITIVVPYPAGGATDLLARGVGQKLSENLNINVLVDNRPGGSAQIAANAVKQGPADGSVLFMGEIGSFAMNQTLYSKLSYDVRKDFTAVGRVAIAPSLLIVPASSPFNTLPEFIKAAREKSFNIASQGLGSGGHIFIELFRREAQLKLNHVPYRGSAPAVIDLVGAQVDILLDPILSSAPFVKDGKAKILAVGSDHRVAMFPQVPTLKEAGYAESNVDSWYGLVAKAGTPRATLQRLSDEVGKAVRSPDVAKRFTDQGIEMAPMNATEFQAFIDSEVARWGKVIKQASISLD
ncbi:Tripartite-type tricarboxylate transporter, receptor component TctC [Variovorax sp. HW608]|uniref:Bug family tripartite tricarboxylate transporter substrate binding protein n=1 Tax=Variovorax sp. HW608 TaxID=1034889 RepID=UPI00081FDD8D|nr:tripartite tricarboxylate transporter substrate binding protein [Variovorax sp. HW608]SCK14231.1 Tripartite-type tricarboxylate transporter, receptor component TctC [Variovorax sp. HW608]